MLGKYILKSFWESNGNHVIPFWAVMMNKNRMWINNTWHMVSWLLRAMSAMWDYVSMSQFWSAKSTANHILQSMRTGSWSARQGLVGTNRATNGVAAVGVSLAITELHGDSAIRGFTRADTIPVMGVSMLQELSRYHLTILSTTSRAPMKPSGFLLAASFDHGWSAMIETTTQKWKLGSHPCSLELARLEYETSAKKKE